jgi:hypothetical protein
VRRERWGAANPLKAYHQPGILAGFSVHYFKAEGQKEQPGKLVEGERGAEYDPNLMKNIPESCSTPVKITACCSGTICCVITCANIMGLPLYDNLLDAIPAIK